MIHPKRAVYMGFVQVNLEYSLLRYIEFSFRDVRWWQGCDDETGEENAGVDYLPDIHDLSKKAWASCFRCGPPYPPPRITP